MRENRIRCRDVAGMLSAYLEHELPDDQAAAVRVHLDRCPVCRADAQRMSRALGALHSLRPSDMPDSVRAGLYARIAALERPQASPVRRLRYAGAVAVVLLAVTSAAYLANRSRRLGIGAPDDAGVRDATPQQTRVAAPAGVVMPAAPTVAQPNGSGPMTASGVSEDDQPRQATRQGFDRLRAKPKRGQRVVHTAPTPDSILDVADKRGVTARMLLAAGADSGAADAPRSASGMSRGPAIPVPHLPRALDDITAGGWRDRVRIGDTVTELRGTADRDASGRLRSIHVSATTELALERNGETDPSGPSPSTLTGASSEPERSDETERQ